MRSGIAAALLLALLPPVALAQPGTQLTIAQPAEATTMDPGRSTQIIHEEKPSLELFQEVVVYGTSKRVSFKVRPDYRLMVSEMTLVK
jgi:hypothetical protein